jgi:2-polyprenyl-6-methoxyphenol hydroxylase-like FAD-dependent oxidoreductase
MLFLFSLVVVAYSLSSPKPNQQQQRRIGLPGLSTEDVASKLGPVKKICVVGAGIAGLSLAHALTNSQSLKSEDGVDIEVSIYDSRRSLDFTTGSGVQLNGGIACLGKINPELQAAVIDAAVPISYLRGRNKSWFQEGEVDRLWDYSVEDIIRSDDRSRQELIDENNKVLWYGIMRGKLQQILLDSLPSTKNIHVEFDKKLTGITASDGTTPGAMCKFSDGSFAGPFDLIVGADGVKSAVKQYIEHGIISPENDSFGEARANSLYTGIRINYAVQDQPFDFDHDKEGNNNSESLQQVFADGAYALMGKYGNGKECPPCQCFFVISLDDNYNGPFRREKKRNGDKQNPPANIAATSEIVDWSQNSIRSKDESRQKMLKQIKEAGISDSAANSIILNSDRFFELGVYFHNPISLSGWSKQIPSSGGSYAVLCGDAAHAMPPFLGQGTMKTLH